MSGNIERVDDESEKKVDPQLDLPAPLRVTTEAWHRYLKAITDRVKASRNS
jgi:hypothetical protein